jgi:rubrerythrin
MAKHNKYFCNSCNKNTLFVQDTPNHILHLILTIFTVGLWLIIWFFVAVGEKNWHCSVCGSKPSGSGWGIAGDVYRRIEANTKGDVTDPEEKECPMCAETVKSKAVVCRFCGHEFKNSTAELRQHPDIIDSA